VEAIWSALIAVAGTLLGSVSTFVFQRAGADRAERAARFDQRRQERLAMYAEFAAYLAARDK
jgi:membrane protein YqaA with SNARE-associated domain